MSPRWHQLHQWHSTNLCRMKEKTTWIQSEPKTLKLGVTDFKKKFQLSQSPPPQGENPGSRNGTKGSLPQFSLFKNYKKLLSREGRSSYLSSGKCFLYHVDKHIQDTQSNERSPENRATGQFNIKGHSGPRLRGHSF